VIGDQHAMVARLGGDEFAVLLQHGLIEHGESAPDVGRLAEAINTELAEPIYLGVALLKGPHAACGMVLSA
jgi:GGDEF domain-containing protein